MSTYSASKTVAWRNRRRKAQHFRGRPLSLAFVSGRRDRRVRKPGVGPGSASRACGGRTSGDWTRTHQLCGRCLRYLRRHFPGDGGGQPARAVQCRPATACAVAAGIGVVPDAVGSRDRKVRGGCRCRSSRRRSPSSRSTPMTAQIAGQHLCLRKASARRICHRRHRRLPDRRVDRLVAQRRLLGASGAAVHRPAAGDGVAADRVLHLPVELERQHVPDRAGDRISGHGADLVRRRERQQRLLRRGADARRKSRRSWC